LQIKCILKIYTLSGILQAINGYSLDITSDSLTRSSELEDTFSLYSNRVLFNRTPKPEACWSGKPEACWSGKPEACWSSKPEACWSGRSRELCEKLILKAGAQYD